MADVGAKIVQLKGAGKVTLHAIGDFQFGSRSCDTWLLKNKIQKIVDDPSGGMSVILGDITDDDRPTTRMRKAMTMADRPEVQDAAARDFKFYIDHKVIPLVLPLAKTKHGIIGVLAGHHWGLVRVKDHRGVRYVNSARYISDELSRITKRHVPYLGIMSAWIWIVFRGLGHASVRKLVHIQHGVGGGQTLASALNKLETTSRWAEADLLIRAHDCKLVAGKLDRLSPKELKGDKPNRALKSRPIALLNIGSMTRGYEITQEDPDYIENEMMRPTSMGWGKAHFEIDRLPSALDPSRNWDAEITCEV